jgi:hypothetical protein
MKMHPIFEALASNDLFDHITFYSVNGPLVKAYTHAKELLNEIVTGYPTIFFMNQGKLVDKQVGGATHDVIARKLTKHLPKSSTGLTPKKIKNSKKTKQTKSNKPSITAIAVYTAAGA